MGIVLQYYILVQTFHRFFPPFSIITFVVEHHVHPMTGQHQESHVDIPTSLQPVVVLVDGVGVHLHIDLLILQLRDVMNCLREISEYQATVCQQKPCLTLPILTGLSILLSTMKLNSFNITSPSTIRSGSFASSLNSSAGIGGYQLLSLLL